jgi:hypothetical protein
MEFSWQEVDRGAISGLTGRGRPKIGSPEISGFSVDGEGKPKFAVWGKFEEHYGNTQDFRWKSSKPGICGWRKISRDFRWKRRGESCGAAGSLFFQNWKLEDVENTAGTIWGN